jgi:hypothetical protein
MYLSAYQKISMFVRDTKAASGPVPASHVGGHTYKFFDNVLNKQLIPLVKSGKDIQAEKLANESIQGYLKHFILPDREQQLRAEFQDFRDQQIAKAFTITEPSF